MVQAVPGSLATTAGISVDFCSSAYLDVSVQRVRSTDPMYSDQSDPHLIGSLTPIANARFSEWAFASTVVLAKAN